MLDIKGIYGLGVNGTQLLLQLNTLVGVFCMCYWVYTLFRHFKKLNQSESTKAFFLTWIKVLIVLFKLFKGFSLHLRMFSRPFLLPFMTACNFLSEIPTLLLFLFICTGWPLVKKPLVLQQKRNMVAVAVFFMELILVPYFVMVVFPYYDRYNPNLQYFESFNLFKFVLLFQTLKSATLYLKEKGMTTYSEKPINVYYTKLISFMVFYYPSYLAIRAILAYFSFNSVYRLLLNELLSLALFYVMTYKFIPEALIDDPKILARCKDTFSELIEAHPLLF